MTFQLLFNIAVKSLGFFPRVMVGKDGVSVFCRQLFTVVGRASLKDNRTSLRRAANIQRAGNLEEITVVIKSMQFRRIKELSALFIADKGIPFPGIPQPLHHVEILIGNAVAQRMLRVFFAGEVLR